MEPSVDTLGRWMAHYIAGLITEVKEANGEARLSAEKRCFEAILTLWQHRGALPDGKRPFEELEPILRAIASLDPDRDVPHYFHSARLLQGETDESEVKTWLDMAEGLDYSAKILIRYCLAEAAGSSKDNSKEWIQLAKSAGADSDIDEIVIRFISKENEIRQDPDPNDEAKRLLQDRIIRLEKFSKMSETVLQELKTRLAALPPQAE